MQPDRKDAEKIAPDQASRLDPVPNCSRKTGRNGLIKEKLMAAMKVPNHSTYKFFCHCSNYLAPQSFGQ
jgi:hypothetical protein